MSANVGLNNLTITRGAGKTHRITIDNPPLAGIGSWTFRLYVYPDGKVTDPILSKTTGFSVSGATVSIAWDSADTNTLPVGSYPYVLLGDDNLVTAFGSLTISPGVPS